MPGVYAQRRAAACHLGCHSPIAGRPHRTAPDRTAAELTGRIGRSYARPAMPAPEPSRQNQPRRRLSPRAGRRGQDVSAVPAFLREGSRPATRRPARAAADRRDRCPRPATPPRAAAEPAPRRARPGRAADAEPLASARRHRRRRPRSRACSRSASCARSARRRQRRIAPPSCAPRTPPSRPRSSGSSRT